LTLHRQFVEKIYADHNGSKAVRQVLNELLTNSAQDAAILNIGAGHTRLDPRIKTLELKAAPGIDYVGSVTALPIDDNSLDLVITQEVLEHVDDPFLAMCEIYRVLKPGGQAYVQLPFIIGFHPCPDDYWRFTHRGIEQLARQASFREIRTGLTVGPAAGVYRIAVEFCAILFSRPVTRSYKVFKGIFALLLYPLKLIDPVLNGHPEAHRISGGFFVTLKK
jgi:SAM-dependent methyltransferase